MVQRCLACGEIHTCWYRVGHAGVSGVIKDPSDLCHFCCHSHKRPIPDGANTQNELWELMRIQMGWEPTFSLRSLRRAEGDLERQAHAQIRKGIEREKSKGIMHNGRRCTSCGWTGHNAAKCVVHEPYPKWGDYLERKRIALNRRQALYAQERRDLARQQTLHDEAKNAMSLKEQTFIKDRIEEIGQEMAETGHEIVDLDALEDWEVEKILTSRTTGDLKMIYDQTQDPMVEPQMNRRGEPLIAWEWMNEQHKIQMRSWLDYCMDHFWLPANEILDKVKFRGKYRPNIRKMWREWKVIWVEAHSATPRNGAKKIFINIHEATLEFNTMLDFLGDQEEGGVLGFVRMLRSQNDQPIKGDRITLPRGIDTNAPE